MNRPWIGACLALGLLVSGCVTGGGRTSQSHIPSAWPTDKGYPVTSVFGPRQDPLTRALKNHNGLDIAAPNKSDVFAAGAGRVCYSGRTDNGYGNLIGIDHGNGLESWYAHLSKRKAKVGRRVDQGQVIGKVGKTGRATAPHLHFEVRHQGKPIDPALYIAAEPRVRVAREEGGVP
ncbi:MAG: hypothetical protein AMXMBFR84_25580 [Candidatus Hydrogenedentota bacterium]